MIVSNNSSRFIGIKLDIGTSHVYHVVHESLNFIFTIQLVFKFFKNVYAHHLVERIFLCRFLHSRTCVFRTDIDDDVRSCIDVNRSVELCERAYSVFTERLYHLLSDFSRIGILQVIVTYILSCKVVHHLRLVLLHLALFRRSIELTLCRSLVNHLLQYLVEFLLHCLYSKNHAVKLDAYLL